MAETKTPMDAAAFALWLGSAEHGLQAKVNRSRMCWISSYDDTNNCFWMSFGDEGAAPDHSLSFNIAADVVTYLVDNNIAFDDFEEQFIERPDDLITYRVRVSAGEEFQQNYRYIDNWEYSGYDDEDVMVLLAECERKNTSTFEQTMDVDGTVIGYCIVD